MESGCYRSPYFQDLFDSPRHRSLRLWRKTVANFKLVAPHADEPCIGLGPISHTRQVQQARGSGVMLRCLRRKLPAFQPLYRHLTWRHASIGIQEVDYPRRGTPFRDLGRKLMHVQRVETVLRQAARGPRTRRIVAAQLTAIADHQYAVRRHSIPRRAFLHPVPPARCASAQSRRRAWSSSNRDRRRGPPPKRG